MKEKEDIYELILAEAKSLSLSDKIDYINKIKLTLKEISPFNREPVDCVVWIPNNELIANDYNPNSVAPPEMQLLKESILQDGYTQPIVAWKNGEKYEVVDGFHRNRVGKEIDEIKTRIHGYLPISIINNSSTDRANRIAATIRHNRARGKHKIDAMSDIVIELKNRNWTDERIAKELGMDKDEILRLCQITGMAELFKDEDFSKSWDIKDSEATFEELNDEIDLEEKEQLGFRTVNTSDEKRIFHTYEKWECYKSGFYNSHKEGMTRDDCELEYKNLLSNENEFRKALDGVIKTWKYSCEHYLTNESLNRIAYLGQAALCYAKGIPSVFRGGFNLLTQEEQDKANKIALEYLNIWLVNNGRQPVCLETAMTDRQSTIY